MCVPGLDKQRRRGNSNIRHAGIEFEEQEKRTILTMPLTPVVCGCGFSTSWTDLRGIVGFPDRFPIDMAIDPVVSGHTR